MTQETSLLGKLWQPGEQDVTEENKDDLGRSFLAVRKAIGYLGIFLPLSLLAFVRLARADMEGSISGFYYTPMRDVFVGTLVAIGVFLVAYTGYRPREGERVSDRTLAVAAGLAVMVVAFVPTAAPGGVEDPPLHARFGETAMTLVHLISAGAFFGCLAALSWWKFPLGENPTASKQGRNRIYKGCALAIALCLVLLFLLFATRRLQPPSFRAWVDANPVVFWLEAIGVFAFGFSWLTKGKTLAGRLAGQILAPRRP